MEIQNKNIDFGQRTLETINVSDNFNKWMFNTISDFCFGKILEIGSGIGNISYHFLKSRKDIVLSDLNKKYIEILRDKFREYKPEVIPLDISTNDFSSKYPDYTSKYDSVFALNVIEHIEDDNLAVKNCSLLLKANGILIILVPAYQALFNHFDTELGHYRRYTKKSLSSLIKEDFNILHLQYFNSVGILGWWLNGNLLKKKNLPDNQMQLFDKFVPLFKIIDKIIFNQLGLSVIVVCKKKQSLK